MVYVDRERTFNPRFKNWCHLFADDLDELHEFAEKLGLKRSWFQDQDPSHPHYDISPKVRAKAVQMGAKEATSADLLSWIQRTRIKWEQSRSK